MTANSQQSKISLMDTFSLTPLETFGISILVIWTLFWKGMALWKSAKDNDKIWFVVLLVLNTAGILDILYLFVFSKREAAAQKQQA